MRTSAVTALATVPLLISTVPSSPSATPGEAAAAGYVWTAVSSTVETDPVASAGDAADDPAIWVNRTNPRMSLVIGNNKTGAIETYGLDGHRVQRITPPSKSVGNVDVRGNLVAVSSGGIRLYSVNPSTRQLTSTAEGSDPIQTSGEGLCMYDPGASGTAGGLYVFTITRDKGRVREYALRDRDGDGLLTGDLVRDFTIGTESEGCVTDDTSGSFFVSEEDVAVWRYGAGPDAGTSRTKVAPVNTALPADAEGLTIAGALLLVSAQNVADPGENFINVYRVNAPFTYVGRIRIEAGTDSDDCDRTDGIAAYDGNLGPSFPTGLLVCQDGNNGAPGTSGHQDFKLAPLGPVLTLG
jgi:myo-inositol-hexaphosphate 3-phosphohydrolase